MTMPSLMFHDIVSPGAEDSSGFPGRDAALYKVTPAAFAGHLKAIAAPGRSATITFDDGGVSALRAADILERFNQHGFFFITANYIGTRGFVDRRDLRDLCERGHVIGSHSATHPLRMGHCTWPQLLDEWTRSRAILSDILGADVVTASVPGGDFAPAVAVAAAEAGLTRLFTSEPSADARGAFGLTLQGRFTIQRWTTPATVAGLAAGDWLPVARQAVVWNAKKLAKRVGGARYLQLRRMLVRHGHEVRWGDQH